MRAAALLLLLSWVAAAQPQSGIARHVTWGSSLPATCSPSTGDIFFLTAAGPTGTLYTCTAANTWTAGGVTSASSLTNLQVTKTDSTHLAIGTTSNVGVGSSTSSVTGGGTATISAGSDTTYIYVASDGTLTVAAGTNTVVCSGCTKTTGTAFPSTAALTLATVTASSGTWGTVTDNRPFLRMDKQIIQGTGMVITELPTSVTVAADSGAWVQTLAQGVCTTCTSTSSGATAVKTITIPANTLAAGDKLLIDAIFVHTGTTDVPRINITFGATSLLGGEVVTFAADGYNPSDGFVSVLTASTQEGWFGSRRPSGG